MEIAGTVLLLMTIDLLSSISNAAKWILALLCTFAANAALAQPANDNCNNASVINITNSGFGLGTFSSATYDLTAATLQTGETFAPAILVAGQNKKSMWYKFTLPTTRVVRVTLAQPGVTIKAGDAGFAVYKANVCLPTNANISTKLTPIGTFGNTYHPCVDSGVYYIQVSGNNNANGPLYIDVQVSDSTGAAYDHPWQAYNFGVVNPNAKSIDYTISCQSIEDASETCSALQNASQYHKSSWLTFTTPAYFDFLSVQLAGTNGYFVQYNDFKKFGYALYKGNASNTPLASLTKVVGCDSLVTDGYYAAYKMYKCGDLEPNTTYSIQLFAHETFNADVRLAVVVGGIAPTQAPLPVSTGFPSSNKFGVVAASPNGTATTLTDYLACNARHTTNGCSPSKPASGYMYKGRKYNLSTFFSFTLNTAAAIDFFTTAITPTSCGPSLVIRLFKQSLTPDCAGLDTANAIANLDYYGTVDCLSPGDYVVQVLGTDTTLPYNYFYYGYLNYNSAQCYSSNLGIKMSLRLTVSSRQGYNNYSLNKAGAFDAINKVNGVMAPMVNAVTYQSAYDTFGCQNTVRPLDTLCGPAETKVMYREFAVKDSGIVTFTNFNYYLNYQLFSGDANALATSQSAFDYPAVISGLKKQTDCWNYYVACGYKQSCVTPGTYTFATYGTIADVGREDRPYVQFNTISTKHYLPALAQDMGSILDSVPLGGGTRKSDVDYFSCKDNAVPINGYTPCKISNIAGTKAIYRQFYLKEDALVSITNNGACGFASGMHTLFKGKATDGLAGLTAMGGRWNCFNSSNYSGCDLLAAGWYTVVSYGSGPSYENPMQNINQVNGYGSYIGQKDEFTITLTVCASPKYNRPFKASVSSANQPYLVEWKVRSTSTPAFPRHDTTYTLATENFNCVDDTPFIKQNVIPCDTTMTKVAYYVFKTTQVSYMQISTGSFWGTIYPFDVRKDSALLKTVKPIQPCVKGNTKIQLCQVPPGTYTLVIFANSSAVCSGVTPQIYIDQVGVSRFDHANKAYDFGVVPPDKQWHNGKVGDVNPTNPLRAASSDFFYCTTGTQPSDPTNSQCMSDDVYNMYDPLKPYMYQGDQGNNVNIVRRNLWFSFVVADPGNVTVKVDNKTPGKNHRYRFSVFRSDVNGRLDFSTVVATGQVDSTMAQGLTLVGHNGWPNYCNALEDVSFYRDPCTQFEPQRYYVLVENRNPYAYGGSDNMNPNSQIEVSVLVDSVNLVATKFDHFSQAYDFGNIGAGKHTGGTDNYSCATRDASDPLYYANGCNKTLWYKFTSTITGNVRYRIRVNGEIKYSYAEVQLFSENIKGDSTSKGLTYQPGTAFRASDNTYWAAHCVSPGTWYLVLTGCSQVNETVYPEIELVEQEGDFCNRPIVTKLAGAGTSNTSVLVDCHTIGTDYGEFNTTITCPVNALTSLYKTSWFRLDITGNDTLDVTAYLSENTNVQPADIKYRMMTGDCNAMQEQSCVLDAQTQNTYKCLTAGSYYFQVFVPVKVGTSSTQTIGTIELNLSAISHADTCAPINNCLANANFIPKFDCTTDREVSFTNYSTYGTSIKYDWDFGYNGKNSTQVAPSFNFPELSTDKTYNVSLKVTNTACGGKDSVIIPVFIPGRPSFSLGPDTSVCNGKPITLTATTWSGTTYKWNTNAATPTINTTGTGVRTYWVTATYNGCNNTDTIVVNVNPIVSQRQSKVFCTSDLLTLSANRNQGEEHYWNTGEMTSSINVSDTGRYVDNMMWNGCTIRDTFDVSRAVAEPLGNDTAVCLNKPILLNATTANAVSYYWQNGTRQPTFSATTAGTYWVRVSYSNCTITDTLKVTTSTPKYDTIAAFVCGGTPYKLPSGKSITAPGIYRDTARYASGCDSIITYANISIASLTQTNVTAKICEGGQYLLPWGGVVTTAGTYTNTIKGSGGCDSVKNTVTLTVQKVLRNSSPATICSGNSYRLPSGRMVSLAGQYIDTVKYVSGCDSLISTILLSVRSVVRENKAVTICQGQNYTLPSGKVVSTIGTYMDTVRYSGGCDSLISTITVVIKPTIKTSIPVSICNGKTYTLPSGKVVSVAGVYSDTIRYISGCDSLITIVTLSAKLITRKSFAATICSGAAYQLPSGKVVNVAGVYSDTLRYTLGCDSVITTVTLNTKALIKNTLTASICQGEIYKLPSGKTVTSTGVYSDTLKYLSGCDSVVTLLTLNEKPVITTTKSVTICTGQNYTFPSGKVVNAAGVYKDTLHYTTGCDSIVTTITLAVKPVTRANITAAVCSGQTYTLPSGRVVSAAGVYRDTLVYRTGCDSIINTITVTIKPVSKSSISAAICQGQVYRLPSGKVVTSTGVYSDTTRYTSGCDSLVTTVTLTQKPIVRQSMSAAICSGETYTFPSGKIVTQAGMYSDTLRYSTGCDSIVTTIALTARAMIRNNITAAICSGQTYRLPSGKVVSTTGTFNDTLRYTAGCDSVINTVTLTLRQVLRNSISASVCSGENYTTPSGRLISIAGIYQDTVRYASGCDSLISTITVAVTTVASSTTDALVCKGKTYTLPWGDMVKNAGRYTHTYRNIAGCDSLVAIVNLQQDSGPVITLSKSNDIDCKHTSTTLTASGGASYLWMDKNGIVQSTSGQATVMPPSSTFYKLVATNANGCSSADSVEVLVDQSNGGYQLPTAFTPNADGKNDCFGVTKWGAISDLAFSVYDRWGNLVFNTTDPRMCWDGSFKGQPAASAAYIYFVKANSSCGQIIRKGTVVLIR